MTTKNELRRQGLYALEPDEFALKTATYILFKPCPFCGSHAGPVLDYRNDMPLFGDKPLYRSVVAWYHARNTSRCGQHREDSYGMAGTAEGATTSSCWLAGMLGRG